jgi:4-aminobutyrate aminotransferase-like enzyme
VRRGDAVRHQNQSGGRVAAIIVEPMQGTAGNVIPPPGFIAAVRDLAKEIGALFIADEMITGFGRTGKLWGVEHDGVVPDVMTCGKGIGGGFPLAALVSTDELTQAKPFANPSRSSSSLRRQPAAPRRGLAALEIIRRRTSSRTPSASAADARAAEVDAGEAPLIGDVRGKGLLLGVELVKDRAHEGARLEGLHEGALPGVPPPRPRRDELLADHPHQPAAEHPGGARRSRASTSSTRR